MLKFVDATPPSTPPFNGIIDLQTGISPDATERIKRESGMTKAPVMVEALTAALKDEYGYIRLEAAHALWRLKVPYAVDALVEALSDDDRDVRWGAARLFTEIKDPRAVDALIELLKDKDESVRRIASIALQIITGQNLSTDYNTWKEWREGEMKQH